MIRRWFVLAPVYMALLACKGEVVVQDNPETLRNLDDCQKNRAEKDKYIKQLEERLAEHELRQANQELLVTITGNDIVLKAKDGSTPPAAGDGRAPTKEQITSFVKQVEDSRGSMQRCYQNELKKDSNLQARSVTVNIQVQFTATGKVGKANFRPSVASSFATCMNAVATKWQVAGAPTGVVFQQPITLTPQ